MVVNPTWINRSHVLGPVYHYTGITDELALALGVESLPGPIHRNYANGPGTYAYRLKTGLLNVRIDSWVLRPRGPAFQAMLDHLQEYKEGLTDEPQEVEERPGEDRPG